NPGTESVLAMGMAYVIIKESLYDKNFAHYKSTGFDVYRQFILNKYAPENVSKITGIKASVITDLAKKFADPMKKSIAVCGRGKGSQPGSISEFMAVHALNALKGNINAKGGIFTLAGTNQIRWPKVIQDAVARKGVKKARIDGARSGKYPDTKSLLNRLPHVINAEEDSRMLVLFVAGANPCYEMAGTDDVKKVFD
ncbi:MAG: molybdopterin-dependent oxidoreductase, partial [bacterium]|nr:molybdopterin-dependent oxidoreductase [bacterium]